MIATKNKIRMMVIGLNLVDFSWDNPSSILKFSFDFIKPLGATGLRPATSGLIITAGPGVVISLVVTCGPLPPTNTLVWIFSY
jgi:hypothetical protein